MAKEQLQLSDIGREYQPARLVEGSRWWYIEFWVWHEGKGDLVRKRIGVGKGKTPAEKRRIAQWKIGEINALLQQGYVVEPEPQHGNNRQGHRLSVQEALDKAVAIKLAKSGEYGRRNYQSFWNVFSTWLEREGLIRLPIQSLEKRHVYAFLDYCQQERGNQAKTLVNYLTRLTSLCNELVEREIIEESPTKGIKKPKTASRSHKVYAPVQQAQMEEWLQTNEPRLFLFTRLIYFAFFRPVEITRMQVKHIDLRNRVIVLDGTKTKNQKQQGVFIVDPLYEFLIEEGLDQLDPEDFLFGYQLLSGKRNWHRKNVTRAHQRALASAGLDGIGLTLYSWKHTGVCNAYRAGVDIKTLQSLLRHSSLDMTEIYLRELGLRVDENLRGVRW